MEDKIGKELQAKVNWELHLNDHVKHEIQQLKSKHTYEQNQMIKWLQSQREQMQQEW